MVGIRKDELRKACVVLFGPEVDVSPEFLSYIQPSGIKSAYRRLARMTHPDASGGMPDRFIEARWAYESLKRFIELRDQRESIARSAARMKRPVDGIRADCRHRPADANSDMTASSHGCLNNARNSTRDTTRKNTGGNFYSGPLPAKRLLLGEYLFYRGEVSWEALVRAIAWQRSQRPPLGAIARQWGWLGDEDIGHAQSGRFPGEPLGDALVRIGLLTRFQVHSMLMLQRRMQKPFGEYFVLNGYLSRERLDRVLHPEFIRHNARF